LTSERNAFGELPIIVGVTGHRDLRPEDGVALEEAVGRIFDRLRSAYPTTPLLALTPLAEGADRLLARVAIARSIPYLVPTPLPLAQYRDDFAAPAKEEFDALERGALASYAMPYFEDNDAFNVGQAQRRAQQYALVGAHVAQASHVLIAVWNGERSTAVGGTAQIVRFRCYGIPVRYLGRASVLDAPETGAVYHVYAPRMRQSAAEAQPGFTQRLVRGGTPTAEDPYPLAALPPDAPDPYQPLYERIADFNDDCLLTGPRATGATSATARLMQTAEAAATHYQTKSRTALNRLFVATGAAALLLAAYSNLVPGAHALIVPYLAALAIAVVAYRAALRGRWQDRSQDYRALEIGLRVQRVWDLVDLGLSVADYYIRRERSELDWIRDAIRTAHNVDRAGGGDEANGIAAVREFVSGQLAYFARAAKREGAAYERYEALATWSLRAGFGCSALLVVCAAWMQFSSPYARSLVPLASAAPVQAGLIFLVAVSTILAAMLHEYPQRRAFRQHARRYTLMEDLYRRANEALEATPAPAFDDVRDLIFELGREALIENGDWVLLHRELPIELLRV
jgi:hypothetical protein